MWRALLFVGLLAAAAFAAVWLADRPGEMLITWNGYQAQTSVAVGAVLLATAALLLAILWSSVSFLLKLPARVAHGSRTRRRAKGFEAISRGMVAVGAGDAIAARRHAGDAERLVGEEPLALLLTAQSAQVAGDRPGAERAFRRMTELPETRVLGLRGLFVEARRRGDLQAARSHAQEAARLAPAVGWASDAVLEAASVEGDWRHAIGLVERRASLGLAERSVARRQRAVLQTADALAREDSDPQGALDAALAALKLAPGLVPAAVLAGLLLGRRGDLRRAAKILEAAWRESPHPELARVYLGLRPGDSAGDRVRRAETLARLSSWEPESRLALARAAIAARDFGRARETLQPLLGERPTMRIALLMAELEQAEHGAGGRVREWLARATRAPRDKAWIADGVVSERWAPVSPVTGRLDAFVWEAPPDLLGAAGSIEPDFDFAPEEKAALGAPPLVLPEPDTMQGESEATAPEPDDAPPPAAEPASAPAPVVVAASETPNPAPASRAPFVPARPEAVVFPVSQAPDDPGPDPSAETRARPKRLG